MNNVAQDRSAPLIGGEAIEGEAHPADAASVSSGSEGAPPPGGESFCGVAAAVAVLGDAWTLLIVRDLADGPRRFGQLHTSTGISVRVLTDRLRSMGAAGLLGRHMYPEIPPRVEYTLTEKGRAALGVVDALRAFGERWLRTPPAGEPSPSGNTHPLDLSSTAAASARGGPSPSEDGGRPPNAPTEYR